MSDTQMKPHGGKLVDLLVDNSRASEIVHESKNWLSWDLNERQTNDIELLINGGFSPLKGFMKKTDYDSVCNDMRLFDGTLWPIPIVLDVSKDFSEQIRAGEFIVLRDIEGVVIAAMKVEDIWEPDKKIEAKKVYGTSDTSHSGVDHLLNKSNPVYVGGEIEALQLPTHYDFPALRRSPKSLREEFSRKGWNKIVAFQTRNPMHKAHYELTKIAARETEANLLIHPVVGTTKPGDIDHFTRVKCYREIMKHYPQFSTFLSLLPLSMRMVGPREAIWHAIIRKNYGCTHFIIGRDHASPGLSESGKPFYGTYDAHELFKKHEDEIGIKMVEMKSMVYVPDLGEYIAEEEVDKKSYGLSISGTELRQRLKTGREIPEWFTYKEVVKELRKSYPQRNKQGVTIFFTGLSGSGKSTIANAVRVKLKQLGGRAVTLLDGDIVRKNLSSELGFSKEDRDINIRRIGFVASEITKNGGIAICAPIAPYDKIRKEVREVVEARGGFVLIHVATPLEVCEARDRKGLYAKARAGIIKNVTGISDPYEEPKDAEIEINTENLNPEQSAHLVLLHLANQGFIAVSDI